MIYVLINDNIRNILLDILSTRYFFPMFNSTWTLLLHVKFIPLFFVMCLTCFYSTNANFSTHFFQMMFDFFLNHNMKNSSKMKSYLLTISKVHPDCFKNDWLVKFQSVFLFLIPNSIPSKYSGQIHSQKFLSVLLKFLSRWCWENRHYAGKTDVNRGVAGKMNRRGLTPWRESGHRQQ